MLILLLEDEPGSLETLADGLRAAGHVARAAPVETPIAEILDPRPDAVVSVGPQPPEAVTHLAGAGDGVFAVAVLSAESLPLWPMDGPFEEFVLEPVRVAELVLRLALHQCRQKQDDTEVIRSGSLVIDISNYTVSVHDERIELTFKEYELLRFLVSHPGRVFTRDTLLEQVWGYDYWGGSRTIDVHIRRIRSKLPVSVAAQIETVHQVGYRYASPRD
ncbi:MAG TPA: response regulator transcription factor [Armatimonadota bacterium]|jgi:DNA-binding winged helix-turn-helix (wHTH) protein